MSLDAGRYVKRGGSLVSLGVAEEDLSWQRPADWLPLPALQSTDQKVVALVAVFDGEINHLALNAQGAYTVDWGDGTVDNFASNVQANHIYSFAGVSASTLTTRGYRQAIVTVTPQAGQNLTVFNMSVKHNATGLPGSMATHWLDVLVAGPNITTLPVGGGAGMPRLLESFEMLSGLFSGTFSECYRLERVVGINLPSSRTFVGGLFMNCRSLKEAPDLNLSAATNIGSFFSGCYSLRRVPLYDTANATAFNSMFMECRSLTEIPVFNTSMGTNFSNMFQGCRSLRTIPALDFSKGTLISSLFSQSGIETVPPLDFTAATSFSQVFYQCAQLKGPLSFITPNITSMASAFQDCGLLVEGPNMDTTKVTTMNGAFLNCYSLMELPAYNLAAVTNFTSWLASVVALRRSRVTGVQETHSYASLTLSAAALNEIYTNLAAVTGKTITVTGNVGVAGDDPTIATAKGWTVTG